VVLNLCRFEQLSGNEKNWFTYVLTVLTDSTKLPLIVIFKDKQMPKNLPTGITVLMHPKGWIDEIEMKTWFNKVWKKRLGRSEINKQKSLLIMDNFEGHKIDAIKKIALDENTDLAIIPDSLTFIVQLLNVCLNKSFKNRLREVEHLDEFRTIFLY
jgi:hypothetical protein